MIVKLAMIVDLKWVDLLYFVEVIAAITAKTISASIPANSMDLRHILN